MHSENPDHLWRKGQSYSLLVGMWAGMMFLEWQFGGEIQTLLKCAYTAIAPLGIYPKELFSF